MGRPTKKVVLHKRRQARAELAAFGNVGDVHRLGHRAVQRLYLPWARLLAESRRRADQRSASQAYYLLGDVHDLNGAPRAAIRAYERALKLDPRRSDAWRELAAMFENIGELKRARRALLRAQTFKPRDQLVAGDLERVEWSMFHQVPALYAAGSWCWEASELLAAGRPRRALNLLGRRRTMKARMVRARCLGALSDVDGVLREFTAIAKLDGVVQLRQADWFYILQGAVADSSEFWRLMLWKIRRKLEGGCYDFSSSLWDLDVAEVRRFELFARMHLARAEGDVKALLALAGKYAAWREPGEWALRLG